MNLVHHKSPKSQEEKVEDSPTLTQLAIKSSLISQQTSTSARPSLILHNDNYKTNDHFEMSSSKLRIETTREEQQDTKSSNDINETSSQSKINADKISFLPLNPNINSMMNVNNNSPSFIITTKSNDILIQEEGYSEKEADVGNTTNHVYFTNTKNNNINKQFDYLETLYASCLELLLFDTRTEPLINSGQQLRPHSSPSRSNQRNSLTLQQTNKRPTTKSSSFSDYKASSPASMDSCFSSASKFSSMSERLLYHKDDDGPTSKKHSRNSKMSPQFHFMLPLLLIFLSTPNLPTFLNGPPLSVEAIKLQPEGDKAIWSGDSTVVSCRNNNNVKNDKIRWIGPNGLQIPEDVSKRIHTESAGYRLVIKNATFQTDDGQYKCQLGTQGGSGPVEEKDFNLKIYKTPSFEGTSENVIMQEHTRSHLVCRVEFDPSASNQTVTWLANGKFIDQSAPDSAYKITDSHDSSSSTFESKLHIDDVKREHSGIYTCHAIADTHHLSKPFEFEIKLEVQYQPSFTSTKEIIWVERKRRHQQSQLAQQLQHGPQTQEPASNQQQQQANYYPNKKKLSKQMAAAAAAGGASQNGRGSGANSTIVQLDCVSDANPPATIIWGTSSKRLVIEKGNPAHVLSGPRTTVNGTLTSSVIEIDFDLDPNWEHRADEYICSAKNNLGQASKSFRIQQGDAAPAFPVDMTRIEHDPLKSTLTFTILNPKLANNLNNQLDQPEVDAFRVRADTGTGSSHAHLHQHHSTQQHQAITPTANGHFMESHRQHQHQHQQQQQHQASLWAPNTVLLELKSYPNSNKFYLPQNVTVPLAGLPSGSQRLLLEAHSPVGWSWESTDLGEFKLISSGGSGSSFKSLSPSLSASSYFAGLLSLSLSLFIFTFNNNNNNHRY